MNDEKYLVDGRFDLDAMMKDAEAKTRSQFAVTSAVDGYVKTGQYLDDRTKRLMRRQGYDASSGYGDLGSKKARRLQNKLKTNDRMSDRRRKRINKRIKRKGGAPVKMSIELTRPSYKQKGFGK